MCYNKICCLHHANVETTVFSKKFMIIPGNQIIINYHLSRLHKGKHLFFIFRKRVSTLYTKIKFSTKNITLYSFLKLMKLKLIFGSILPIHGYLGAETNPSPGLCYTTT